MWPLGVYFALVLLLVAGMHVQMALHRLYRDTAGSVVLVNRSVRLERCQHDAEVRVLDDRFRISSALPVGFLTKGCDLLGEVKRERGSLCRFRRACRATRRFGFRHD